MSGIGTTINKLVRNQILEEIPQITDSWLREQYVEVHINALTPAELLERISNALDEFIPELSVRLGL